MLQSLPKFLKPKKDSSPGEDPAESGDYPENPPPYHQSLLSMPSLLKENWKIEISMSLVTSGKISSVDVLEDILGVIIDEYYGPIGFKRVIQYCFLATGYHLTEHKKIGTDVHYQASIGGRFTVDRKGAYPLKDPLEWTLSKTTTSGRIIAKIDFSISFTKMTRSGMSLVHLISLSSYAPVTPGTSSSDFQISEQDFLTLFSSYGVKWEYTSGPDIWIEEEMHYSSK
ncbi:matrix protein [Drosophila affinis sigmavirus]|uniref:Matrix protein n=1 Tax=Drosophila affinis sigmavirus TaxID=1308859 RepID=A0A140D8K2_9RHAB|nr:matrix protein [Drosophila affinis sigmavirus]AMK09226.1 matrix protein [Drosophila affinis sigmavirus]